MASSLNRTLNSLSAPLSRCYSAVCIAGFVYCSYLVVRTEVEARQQVLPALPASLVQPEATSTIHSAPPAPLKTQAAPSKIERHPEKARPLPKEGSRREWYQKRKRRWFTPPETKMDSGLPKARGRFRMA